MATKIQYVPKQEARVHRKYKTGLIEETCSDIIAAEGTLTPALLLSEASNKDHPLHEFFDWDDQEAAAKWRIAQARAMILATRYLCYLVEDRKKRRSKDALKEMADAVLVRRFLPSHKGEGFRERSEVLNVKEDREAIIERKLSTLRSWCRSVVDIAELTDIRKAILSVLS